MDFCHIGSFRDWIRAGTRVGHRHQMRQGHQLQLRALGRQTAGAHLQVLFSAGLPELVPDPRAQARRHATGQHVQTKVASCLGVYLPTKIIIFIRVVQFCLDA